MGQTAPVEEVLDFRDRDAETARRLLVETGLRALALGTTKVLVALPGELCVEVRMERPADETVYRAHFAGLQTLAVHRLDPRVFEADPIGGRVFAVPGETVLRQVDTVNWSPDAEFLEFALKRLRKVVAAGDPPVPLSRIPSLATYLVRAGLTPALAADLEPIRSRLPTVAASLDDAVVNVDDIVDVISALRPVAARLEADMAGRREALETELRTDLEDRLRAEATALEQEIETRRAQVDAEVADLEALGDLARTEADATRVAREEMRAALQDEVLALGGNLADLGEGEPRDLVARVAQRLRDKGVDVEPVPMATPPWARVRSHAHHPARAWSEAVAAFEAAAKRFGLPTTDLIVTDVAARSGALVLLPEGQGLDLLRSYASVVACGEIIRQALDPSVLSLDDLWRQPGSTTPTAFAAAWAAAKTDARRYRIVVLEGLHRTPMDLWAPSLVEALSDPGRPTNLLVFATLGANAVDPARAWRELAAHVVPLRPTRAPEISAEMLAIATGAVTPVSCLDALAAGVPSRSEVLAFVDDHGADLPPQALPRVMGVLRSASALAPAVTPADLARAFAAPQAHDGGPGAALAAGATWLQSILETWD